MPRYLIADPDLGKGWTHIFTEQDLVTDKTVERERDCRFVFDTQSREMIHLDIMRRYGGYAVANAAEIADVTDSLVNANEQALQKPEYYGHMASDDLPGWFRAPAAPTPS